MTFLQACWCVLFGHDTMKQYRGNRMYLKCNCCAYESKGWRV
jgi:hypothetical protein